MKNVWLFIVLAVAALSAWSPIRLSAAEADGVTLAIVYDTSGSMLEKVRDSAGKQSPKYTIANRALESIVQQIQTFVTNNATEGQKIHAGLFTFGGKSAREAVKLAPFNAQALEDWVKGFSKPDGGTPLGNAVKHASQCVLDSPLARKHVLVITDGMNTQGPDPAAVLPEIFKRAEKKQTSLSIHFIAFDVDASVFSQIKKLGVTVVGAADEQQLNAQLDFILKNEILLEKAEPTKKN